MDLFDKCKTDKGYYGKFRVENDYYYTRPILDPHPGRRMNFEGREMIMWSVNNYLGLAENEEIKQVALEAVKEFSVSAPMGSRMMSGTTTEHLDLERELADFAQSEAAVLFNYGYMGVLGSIASVASGEDTIVMDKLAHASLVDGVFLAQTPFRVFKHNDMDSLEKVLKQVREKSKGGILVVIEGTYGMTGDLAPLDEICALKDKYGARLLVDDAHGCGALGKEGRGTADYFGVQDKVDIYFSTFAKAFASIGGFSAAKFDVIEWIKYNARTQMFAKSLPMVYVRTLKKTLEILRKGDDLRDKMWQNANKLKDGLRDLGYYVGLGHSPICAAFVPIGDNHPEEMGRKYIKLIRDKGVFVSAVTWPVIPLGLLMFRIIPTTSHTDEDIEMTIQAFREMRQEEGSKLDMTPQDKQKIEKLYSIKHSTVVS